ncbi:hypothetical protein D299_gp254 [Escherichia phage HX01]|nr:hypothetical protein D299_gp254 [Escherichia phage HX01]
MSKEGEIQTNVATKYYLELRI